MLNLKRKSMMKLLIISVIMFAVLLIGATKVEARPGDNAQLSVDNKYLYDGTGSETIETVPGASYDLDSNTLTLNAYNGGRLWIYNMHNLTINIVGNNTISYDSNTYPSAIYSVLGELTITGSGTLNIIDINPYNVDGWASIRNNDSTTIIDGPTINIMNSGNSSILSGGPIEIKNSEINIETTGDYGIYSTGIDVAGRINISNSDITCTASKYGIAGSNIKIDGNAMLTVKTTLDDASAITLYAKEGEINFTTEGSIVLEKADKGTLCSPQPAEEHSSLDSIYKYNITEELNKITYTMNSKASKTLIDLIEIDETDIVPVVGEEPKLLPTSTEEYEIINQQWYDDEEGIPATKFEEGKTYVFLLTIKPNDGYYFSTSTKVNIPKMDEIYTRYDDDSESDSYGNIFVEAAVTIPKTQKYTVTVKQVEGSTVIKREEFEVVEGTNKDIAIILNEGYIIRTVKVNNVVQMLMGNTLTIYDIKENKEVIVEVQKYNFYNVIEGDKQTWNGNGDLKIVVEGDYDKLINLLYNKKDANVAYPIVENVHYTVEKSSNGVIINIKDTLLKTLEKGEYEICAVYSDGEVTAAFTVDDVSSGSTSVEPGDGVKPEPQPEAGVKPEPEPENGITPKTGDNIILYIIVLVVSTLGIALTIILNKKIRVKN